MEHKRNSEQEERWAFAWLKKHEVKEPSEFSLTIESKHDPRSRTPNYTRDRAPDRTFDLR